MKFLNTFFSKTEKQKTEIKQNSNGSSVFFPMGSGQARFTPRRYDRLAEEGFKKNVIAYRCIKLISQNLASIPLIVYKNNHHERLKLNDHPLKELLDKPNNFQSSAEFLEALASYYLISGNAYIRSVVSSDQNILELWAMRPDRISIVTERNGLPKSYIYTVNNEKSEFPINSITGRSDILHIKTFHPLDDWYGLSPMEAAAYSIDQHNEAAKWNASLLQNSCRPSGALIYKPTNQSAPDTLTGEQRQHLKQELEEQFQGFHNSARPLILEGGLDWKEMSINPKDMDWISGKEISAKEIAMAFNIPSQLVGIDGSLTFANFEQARLALYDDAILPLLKHICAELTQWVKPLYGENIEIGFDMDSIEALSPRREKRWEKISNADFLSNDEKKQLLGLD